MATTTQDGREDPAELHGRQVWGIGGPNSGSRSHDGRSALKLHRGISVIAFLLCVLVVVVFLLDHVLAAAIVFAVIALGCVGIFAYCTLQLRDGSSEGSGE